MRLRTIKEAARLVKVEDNDTGATINCIRNLVHCGKVHYIKTGRKVLLDVDDLLRYFSGKQPKEKN